MNAARISNCATATPLAAPVPARPTRCSDPMLDAKSDAPMMNQPVLRPARK
jgi:hypothetical protein